MNLTEAYIEKLAPNANAFKAGKKLSPSAKWVDFHKNERGIWGAIKGSGKNPYRVSIDMQDLAYKCSCPSRQFPCKHSLALLLLHCNEASSFQQGEEPEQVKEWLDKRNAKAVAAQAPPKELTAKDLEKRATDKAKRAASTLKSVTEGIKELDQWLQDLVRLGLIELTSKDYNFFENVAAKMVDAKAKGLAARVRSFSELDYSVQDGWQEDALEIIGQLYLLMKSFENHPKDIETPYLQTLKSLIGWNVQKKNLLEDPESRKVTDQWLVLGSLVEELDDLTSYKTWVQGMKTGSRAYILGFETRFSPGPPPLLIDGTTIEGELIYYPGNRPYRAFVNTQKPIEAVQSDDQHFCESWDDHHQKKVTGFIENPWMNNQFYLIKNVRIVKAGNEWIVCDAQKKYQQIRSSFYQYSQDKVLTMALLANHQPVGLSFVEFNDGILPLGIFQDQKYTCL